MPTPLEIFKARCQARALLWQAGEFTLLQAVDELEAYARELALDTDEAQVIMSTAFATVRPHD